VNSELHGYVAHAAASHGARDDQGMDARPGTLIEIDIAGILRDLAAAAVPADYRGVLLQCRREIYSRVGDSFAGRDHRELREAVQMIGAASFEILGGIVIADFGAVLEADQGRIYRGDWADGSDALLNGAPGFRDICAGGADYADAGDGDSAVGHPLAGRRGGGTERRAVLIGVEDPLDACDDIADGADGAGLVIGDGDIEFAFELEEQRESIEGIHTEIQERGIQLDLLDGNALHRGQSGDYFLLDGEIRHQASSWLFASWQTSIICRLAGFGNEIVAQDPEAGLLGKISRKCDGMQTIR